MHLGSQWSQYLNMSSASWVWPYRSSVVSFPGGCSKYCCQLISTCFKLYHVSFSSRYQSLNYLQRFGIPCPDAHLIYGNLHQLRFGANTVSFFSTWLAWNKCEIKLNVSLEPAKKTPRMDRRIWQCCGVCIKSFKIIIMDGDWLAMWYLGILSR